MRIFVGVLVGLCGVAYSVAQVLRYRREQIDQVSERWLTEREVRDAITRGQVEGVVGRWPIDRDDAA